VKDQPFSGIGPAASPAPPPADHLGSRLEFEALVADLSSRFVHLPPGEVDFEIADALRRVCNLLEIDLAVLWQWSDTAPQVIAPTHVYPAGDDPQAPEPLHQEQYPWYRQEMLAGRMIAISSLEELPAEAAVDRESARRVGIRSNLCLPLAVGGEPPLGALGLNTLSAARDWTDEVVNRLQLVAQVFTNALARKRHELTLRESEARLALAVDSAEAGPWTLDFGTGVFWVTEKARAIFGYSADEIIDLSRLEASVHPDDRDLVREAIERSGRTGEAVDVEYRILRPGAPDPRWIASRGRTRAGSTGAPGHLMGISIDVTERKRHDEALRRSDALQAAGADLAGLASYEVDFVAGVALVDDRFRDLLGLPQEREGGLEPVKFWAERLHPDDRQRILDERQQLHDGKAEQLSVEYRFLHPARGERWFHHMARVSSRDASGRTLKSYGVLRDVTERREAEESLRRSYEEIERLKDRLQAESDYLKAEISVIGERGEITGHSSAIERVLRQVQQVAPTDSLVLVSGETGTGKELVAAAIHRASRRRDHLMVKVNCAALPTGLVESELFGREKGAFTGALTRQVGRFEVADRSTLFLDEIGELPLEVQAKLLRVLETGEFERLGSPRTVKVDVRLIAATNRDLAEEVRKGRFREDLYYRVNVFPIRVPPLRARAEDIPLLVWTFLEELSSRMGKRITQVPRKTMDALQRHPWPGNVRELRNVIERGAIITTGDTLRLPLLDEALPETAPTTTMADAEREHILRALESADGHVKGPKGAAESLGLNPATLYSRMNKLGIRSRRQTDDGSA
jgi:PAS domain S-box-containing protein